MNSTLKTLFYLLSAVIFVGCSSDNDTQEPDTNTDTIAPVITIIGDTNISIDLLIPYSDEGATAVDNVDGDLTSAIVTTNNVDVSQAGNYTVVYEVSDAAGNSSSATRFVEVTAAKTFIPDDAFEQFLIDFGVDDVLDDFVLTANIVNIDGLFMPNSGIEDMTGIEDFVALQNLGISDNPIATIDLSQNANLVSFECKRCGLDSIDLSQNLQLENVLLQENALINLDLSNNPLITLLFLTQNSLTEINLPQGSPLVLLDCSFNQLAQFDLSTQDQLARLDCNDNQLTSLDLSVLPALTLLNAENNALTELNLANGFNENISEMNALNNQLDCIQIDPGFVPPANGWQKDETAEYSDDCS